MDLPEAKQIAEQSAWALAHSVGEYYRESFGQDLPPKIKGKYPIGPFAKNMDKLAQIAANGTAGIDANFVYYLRIDLYIAWDLIPHLMGLYQIPANRLLAEAQERLTPQNERIGWKDAAMMLDETPNITETVTVTALHPHRDEDYRFLWLDLFEVDQLKARRKTRARVLQELKEKERELKS